MDSLLRPVRGGLGLATLGLLFGFGLGIAFGVAEDAFKDYVANGVATHADVHDAKSEDKIWRYAQRAHFHATGVAAFSIGLIVLVMLSTLPDALKRASAWLIGMGAFYPLSWFTMYLVAPLIGRDPAHHHVVTETFTYVGVGGLGAGMLILFSNLFLRAFAR